MPGDRVKISTIPPDRMDEVYNWPADYNSTYRHVTHFTIMRKLGKTLHRIRDILPDNQDTYILTATLLPRPGKEHEGVIDVEIDTIGSYSIDFGDKDTDFSRGIWLLDRRPHLNLYYQLHQPASEEYQTLNQEAIYDNSKLFEFHDALLGTEMVKSNDIDEMLQSNMRGVVIADGKYAKLVWDGENPSPFWHIKPHLTVELLCEQEPGLDAEWIQDPRNANLFWDHCKIRINFGKSKEFNKSLSDLRKGKKIASVQMAAVKKSKPVVARPSPVYREDSEDDSDDAESDDSREVGKKHAKSRDKASKKSSSEASRSQKSVSSPAPSAAKPKSLSVDSAPAKSGSSSTGTTATIKKRHCDESFEIAQQVQVVKPPVHRVAKFVDFSKQSMKDTTTNTVAALKLQQQAAAAKAKLAAKIIQSDPEHLSRIANISLMQANEEAENLRRRILYQNQNHLDGWASDGTSLNPDDRRVSNRPNNRRSIRYNEEETKAKWEKGCSKICCCREMGSHPQKATGIDGPGESDIPIIPPSRENFECYKYQGYDNIKAEPKNHSTCRIKWLDTQSEFISLVTVHNIDTSDNWSVDAPWYSRGKSM